jgi:Tol biopolymer transport system component
MLLVVIILVITVISFRFICDFGKRDFKTNRQNVKEENELAQVYQSELVRLTLDDTDDLNPVFSPNGKQIAYLSDTRPCIINLDGTNKRLLSKEKLKDEYLLNATIKWSPDGRKIVFAYNTSVWEGNLLIFDLDTKTIKKIDNFYSADWSLDGKELVSYDAGSESICTIDSKGEGRRILLPWQNTAKEDPCGAPIKYFNWVLEDKIYFWTYYRKEKMKIRQYISDFIELDINTLKTKVVLHNDLDNEYVLLSPGKSKLLFSSFSNRNKAISSEEPSQLFVMDIYKNKQEKLSDFGIACDWSPDAKKVLYWSITEKGWDLFIKDIFNLNQWRLKGTESQYVADEADWSPDGQWIVLAISQSDTNKDGEINPLDNHNIVLLSIGEGLK